MKNTNFKRTLAFIAAMSLTASLAACNSDDSGSGAAGTTETTTETTPAKELNDEDKAAVAEIDVGDAEILENGTVRWLSNYDINPEQGKPKRVALELFETKYGGNIEYINTVWDERYDNLATLIVGGQSPDIFPAQEFDTFPGRVADGMFEAWDDYFDFNDADMWSNAQGAKKISDMHVLGGKHYVATVYAYADCVMIYNQNTIDQNALDDPWELFQEGNWTWDTFRQICSDFTDPENDQYAFDGWWFETGLALTTGVAPISFENGQLKNNLMSPELERVENFLYEMKRDGLPLPKDEFGWAEMPDRIGSGNTLFWPTGMWALWEEEETLLKFGKKGEIKFVPLPRDPNADAYYVPVKTEAYALCKGAPNPEGAAAFMKCVLAEGKDKSAQEISEKQYREEYGWTDEMFEMSDAANDLMNANPMISFAMGLPSDVSHEIDEGLKSATYRTTDWGTTRETINGMTDIAVEEINAKLAALS